MKVRYIDIRKNEYGLFELYAGESLAHMEKQDRLHTYKDIVRYMESGKVIPAFFVVRDDNRLIIDRIERLLKQFLNYDIQLLEEKETGEKRQHDNTAFLNGFRAAVTGLYPDSLLYQGVKHIFAEQDIPAELQTELLLASGINSSVVLNGKAEIPDLGIAWLDGQEGKENIIGMKEGIELFTNIYSEGKFPVKYTSVFMEDECMWLDAGACRRNADVRIRVSDRLERCDQVLCGIPLAYSRKLKNREQKRRELENGCDLCSAKRSCCKCFQAMKQEEVRNLYCAVKRKNPYLKYALQYKNILKSFVLAKQIGSEEEIRISAFPVKGLQTEFKNTGEDYKIDYFLWKYKENYYMYAGRKGKYIKIPPVCAYVLEIMYMSRENSFVEALFTEKYEIHSFYKVMQSIEALI